MILAVLRGRRFFIPHLHTCSPSAESGPREIKSYEILSVKLFLAECPLLADSCRSKPLGERLLWLHALKAIRASVGDEGGHSYFGGLGFTRFKNSHNGTAVRPPTTPDA